MSQYGMTAANCLKFPDLQPNPDISGIGVLVAFMTTAYLTLLCCITKYILDHKRAKAQLSPKLDRWAFALGAAIVSFSDQQVITGISIIIGGLSQLQWGIAVYHWQSVVNLAWFSTITHLITLTVLRDEVRKNKAVKIFRITGMGILIMMLISVMTPIGFVVSEGNRIPNAFPAWCLYQRDIEWAQDSERFGRDFNWWYELFAIGLLLYSFLTRVALLLSSRHPADRPWRATETALDNLQQKAANTTGPRRVVILVGYKLTHSVYAMMVTGDDMYQSKAWEVTWLTCAIAWGTLRIFISREGIISLGEYSNLPPEVLSQNSTWGFGQVVALALLMIPLVTFFGAYFSDEPIPTIYQQPSLSQFPVPLLGQAMIHPLTQMRQNLCSNFWYKKLLALWYFLSLAIAADLLYSFPAGGGIYTLGNPQDFLFNTLQYTFWVALNLGILWLSTLILLDEDIKRKWQAWQLGAILSQEHTASVLSFILILCLICISVLFDVLIEFQWQLRPGIPRLEVFQDI